MAKFRSATILYLLQQFAYTSLMRYFIEATQSMTKYCLVTVLIVLQHLTFSTAKVGTFKTITTGPKPLWNDTHLDKLKKHLFLNYDRFVRPDNVTELGLTLTITRLETDEARSAVVVDAWVAMDWKDSKLKWLEEDYGKLNVVRIANHEVWKPDIYLYNSVFDEDQSSVMGNTNALIYPNGQVLWVPPLKLTAFCSFDLLHWPFDRQHCSLKFMSWTLSTSQLKYNKVPELTIEKTASGSSWHIDGYGEMLRKQYPCCAEPFDEVVFHLNIKRKSTPYCAIVVAPAVVCTFMILAQFLLPPNAEEKIILNGFTVLLLNLFLFYFNKQVYASGSQTPLIVLFYSWCLYLAGVATTVSVVLYLMSTVENAHPPLRCIKNIQKRLAKWLCLMDTEDWVLVAACVDRLMFMVYALIFLSMAIAFT